MLISTGKKPQTVQLIAAYRIISRKKIEKSTMISGHSVEQIHSVRTNNNLKTSYFTQLKYVTQ